MVCEGVTAAVTAQRPMYAATSLRVDERALSPTGRETPPPTLRFGSFLKPFIVLFVLEAALHCTQCDQQANFVYHMA